MSRPAESQKTPCSSCRSILPGIVALFVAAGLASAALAAPLETAAGLRLEISGQGRVTGLHIGQTVLPMKGQGGFALADFHRQPTPLNLVGNPGFEEGTKGWHLAAGQSIDTRVFHSGGASVRLEVPGPKPGMSNLGTVVAVKPNTRYRVGVSVRQEKAAGWGAYSSELDDQGRPTAGQVGPYVPPEQRKDGVWLPLSWEITTGPKTTRLSLRADIYNSTGTLWVDDFFVTEFNEGVYEPILGRVTAEGKQSLNFAASLPDRGLEVKATLRAEAECIRVDGVVQDTTGRDRAVGVRFALPLDLTGWTWWHDAEEREEIQLGFPYRNTYKCVAGIGVCSIYPWLAVSGPAASRRTDFPVRPGKVDGLGNPSYSQGLTLALPLSQGPRVFVLQHDQRTPETSLSFYFGLAKDAGHNPSRAPFSFVLYPHDPAWGMRSAMQRYYRLFPESFVKRPTYEGYLNYCNYEQFDPATHQLALGSDQKPQLARLDDYSDFGEGYKFVWELHGCYDFHPVPYPSPRMPDDKTVFGLLQDIIEREKTHSYYYLPVAELLKKLVYGPAGQIVYIPDTRYMPPHQDYNSTDKPQWGLNFRVNEDPDVSPFLADVSRRAAETYAKTPDRRPWDAAFSADGIEGATPNSEYCNGIDYRRDHFATTLLPLTFGLDNRRPATANAIWDFHHKAWRPISRQHQIVTYGNANEYQMFFLLPYVDVPMAEVPWDWQHPGRMDRYLRAVAYHKVWRYWNAWGPQGAMDGNKDPASVRAQFRHGLAYAIFPAAVTVQLAAGNLESYRTLFRQYVPAIEELSRAGWQPVPYATADAGVVVERFGDAGQGELYFTLRNYADKPAETLLRPDWQALGCPKGEELVMLDLLPGTPRLTPFPRQGCRLAIEADGSRAIWVGSRRQAARHAFRAAAATLEKIERLFHAEMRGGDLSVWKEALRVARAGADADEGRALAMARQLLRQVEAFQSGLKTESPVDLAKLVFRLKAQVSAVPAALLNIVGEAPRVVTRAGGGGTIRVTCKLAAGQVPLSSLRCRVISPWREIEKNCTVSPPLSDLPAGRPAELEALLAAPANPPRRLLPFLLELGGKSRWGDFTVDFPVDVQVEK